MKKTFFAAMTALLITGPVFAESSYQTDKLMLAQMSNDNEKWATNDEVYIQANKHLGVEQQTLSQMTVKSNINWNQSHRESREVGTRR